MTYEVFIAFKTIVVKETLRFARIWIQTILPSVITIFFSQFYNVFTSTRGLVFAIIYK